MTEIAIHQPGGMSIPDKLRYAEALAGSNLLPKHYQRQPANLLIALEYAESLGISPINAITGIFVVEGKPSASADLIASMIRKAGHKLRVSGDDRQALAQLIRADDPEFTYEVTWTMDRARTAGLANKAVWKSYPAAMLRSRAITEVARMGASDALFGVIYTPEELGAQVDGDGAMVTAPAPALAPTQQQSGTDRLRAAINVPAARAEEPTGPVIVQSERAPNAPAAPLGNPDGITRAQLTALNAALTTDLEINDRDAKLTYLSEQLGRPITSSAELTKTEASQLIDRIKTWVERQGELLVEDPPDDEPADADWPDVATAGAR